MIWSFKNKLRSLSEDEFTEYLQKKDSYSKKQHPYIVQEARNRYFSNKVFNGDDDQYINPRSQYSITLRRKTRIKRASLILSFFIITTSIFFIIRSNPQITDKLLSAVQIQNNNEDLTPKTSKQAIMITENETSDKSQLGEENKEVSISKEATQRITPSSSKPVSTNKQSEITKAPEQISPKQKTETNTKSQENKTVAVIPPPEKEQNLKPNTSQSPLIEIDNKEKVIEEKIDITKADTSADTSTKNRETKPTQNLATEKPALEEQAPLPNKKPEQKEPINSLVDVSKLPTKRLREFIPFLNDWAYQQTNSPGIADYYVENNSTVNFQLAEEYTDSLSVFQQSRSKQLIEQYQKVLSTTLGDSFPKVAIKIHFVDSDTDL